MRLRVFSVVAILGLSIFASRSVQAFEKVWQVGAGAGILHYSKADADLGPLLAINGVYGLNDSFDVRAELGASWQSMGGDRHPLLGTGTLGLTYKLDVIEWVPWIGVSAGGALLDPDLLPDAPGEHTKMHLLFGGIAGLDYAYSRELGFGLELGYHFMQSTSFDSEAKLFSALFRVERRFGW